METSSLSFNNGIKKLLLRDYAGAVTDFTRSIEEEPNNIATYNNRGFAKNKLNDTTDEIADYSKAIEIDPEDETALFNRGISKVRLRDYPGAITDLNRVIEISPQNSKAYYYRAISRDNTKIDTYDQQAMAVADILKALEINPDLQIPFINSDPERDWIHY
ncbi:MAG TPA: tetratricopeptide repeat protein [Prolixibacteraceae bacterium]